MKRIIFIVVSIIMMISCNDVLHDEEFTLIRKPFDGNQIKTNGYYYTYENKGNYSALKKINSYLPRQGLPEKDFDCSFWQFA